MLSSSEIKKYLDIAKESALAGGEILKGYWGKLNGYQEKTKAGDLVTEADKKSEVQILKILQKAVPDHAIIAEESGLLASSLKTNEFLWAVDPLDGTTNYAHQYPMVAVSVGLIYRGKPLIGAVYNPIFNEFFWAAKGQGAVFNDHPLRVSKVSTLKQSLLATGFAYDRLETLDTNYAEFCHLTSHSHGVRRAGSAAIDLAYVAAGRLDGFWERGLKVWDIAAGVVLVEEAGGRVTAYDQSPLALESGRVLATNGLLHDEISKELLSLKKG